ncbi:MAG: hypothetical protein ACK5WN_11875 [Alphaproteobacteria bacterium]
MALIDAKLRRRILNADAKGNTRLTPFVPTTGAFLAGVFGAG